MKNAGVIAASVAAFFSVAISSKSDLYVKLPSNSKEGSGSRRGVESEKFAPKLDGLRFIETLVTTHR
ncbi:uncharacterized protein A4U43_C06F7570 [Asparagus officinalis]|uniref:Uncharacterized protein n=1 Tax=Asparagus officinalis TaxID=4686 RepID=A0A5P1EK85_ASPOF|nr:uncharacterized protein A4U43_C06F7570 [Asparagus officinalis]